MRLISKDWKEYKKVTWNQKTLCENIFEEWYLKNRNYTFYNLAIDIYWEKWEIIEKIDTIEAKKYKEKLKSIIKEVKKKLTNLWYINIIEYWDETLMTSKNFI
jgi:hypothetical protein